LNPNLKYQIALSLIKGIGPKLTRNLIAYLGSEQAIFDEKKHAFDKIPGIGSTLASVLKQIDKPALLGYAEDELAFIEKHNIAVSFLTDENYPRRLSFCDDAPLLLFSKGNVDFDAVKIISIVGTRRPSDYGLTLCKKLITDLAKRHPGTIIVSGLAYGVDICAHRAALRNNLPTIAVLAHGLDRIYPSTHNQTARDIVSSGALLTEFMINTNPDRQNFVKRNRIVAGLTDAVVVIESATKGGALITAEIANSYSRDVMAFPGRVGDETSSGCNRLIKSNVAALIESVDDLEYVLGWETSTKTTAVQGSLFAIPETPEEKTIIDILLIEKEMNLNLLALQCAMPVGKVSATLLDLEFKGMIKSRPGGIYKLI
jgi:DNA processing protein